MPARRTETPFDTYLREIREVALLTPEQERALARIIQRGEDDAHEAREQLVRANLRLVVSTAKRWTSRGLSLPDLVEEGNLGLLHATELFDPEYGVRFSTYATWWIEQAIRRSLVNATRTVRIPRHMAQELSRWRAWARKYAQREGRDPDPEDVADAMAPPPAKRRLLARLYESSNKSNVSLDVLFADAQAIVDPRALRPDALDFANVDRHRLTEVIEALPAREAEILKLRYGLDGREQTLTLREIGRIMRLSRERVRQLERTAVERLKVALAGEE